MKLTALFSVLFLGACNGIAPPTVPSPAGQPWAGFANTPQHGALSNVIAQPLGRIHWSVTLDPAPPSYPGLPGIFAHYGSPVITPANTVIVPLKTTATGGYGIEAHAGSGGALIWKYVGDYAPPVQPWKVTQPSYNAVLTSTGRVYFPGAGGKLFYRDSADSAQGSVKTAVFFGAGTYMSNKSAFDSTVAINTPLLADAKGDIYFGFFVMGPNPANLQSGLARIDPSGNGTWVSATGAAKDPSIFEVQTNSAPALSIDQTTVYVVVSDPTNGTPGYLLALDATTLQTKAKAVLLEPSNQMEAYTSDDTTSSPTIGPDGDVYIGVEDFGDHNSRGWLLHFDSTLGDGKVAGSFGYDDTASIVPTSMVPSYSGHSTYLIMTKYNNYYGIGTGDGKNRIAILDPDAGEPDPVIPSLTVMKEVETILGPTPDPRWPGAFIEWCINSAAVVPNSNAVFVNSEDGYLYRWDLLSNTFTQRILLAPPTAEAYTPTAIGPDGQVYAINNARLDAVGM